jgi:four helix bundle protein
LKYRRFEDLPVWQSAAELAEKVYRFTQGHRFSPSLRGQLERAALSVSNNIAEGFERGTTQDLLSFLYIARGSAGEVRSILCVLERLAEGEKKQTRQTTQDSRSQISDLKSEISGLKSLAESISRQLRAWPESLQESPIKGQRYLTEAVRQTDQRKREQEKFVAQLDQIVKEGERQTEARSRSEESSAGSTPE